MALRVVMDTSSLISYLLSGGKIMRSIIAAWREGEISLLYTPQILAELSSVIARQEILQYSAVPLAPLLDGLNQFALHLPGLLQLSGACRDPNDDKFLACAVEGQASYLISSVRDLLEIANYQGICILNPGQFLAVLQLVRLPIDALQTQYTRQALEIIHAELCLDAETRDKLSQAIDKYPES